MDIPPFRIAAYRDINIIAAQRYNWASRLDEIILSEVRCHQWIEHYVEVQRTGILILTHWQGNVLHMCMSEIVAKKQVCS